MTCTQMKCEWIVPSYQKYISYLPVKDIDFRSVTRKKEPKCKEMCPPPEKVQHFKLKDRLQAPTLSEIRKAKQMYSNTKPAILSNVPQYALGYVPISFLHSFTLLLQSLYIYKPEHLELSTVCETVEVQVSVEMPEAVERETKTQLQALVHLQSWRDQMKSVCRTDPALLLKFWSKPYVILRPITSSPKPLTGDANTSKLQEIPTSYQ